tara:strand:+ start:5813 stop:6868 length:1056 start_codon:yes stop_codon:yes gene_type:complete
MKSHVELINKTGDIKVVDAARVSFNKESAWVWAAASGNLGKDIPSHWQMIGGAWRHLSEQDIKLINYLANHNHWTPFGHSFEVFDFRGLEDRDMIGFLEQANMAGFQWHRDYAFDSRYIIGGTLYAWAMNLDYVPGEQNRKLINETMLQLYPISWSLLTLSLYDINGARGPIWQNPDAKCYHIEDVMKQNPRFIYRENYQHYTVRITAPLFVARQLYKHQVGFVANEVSRRYVNSVPNFYYPDTWRQAPSGNKKQGSAGPLYEADQDICEEFHETAILNAIEAYEDMAEIDVCPEQARMILPQSTMTEWYWSATLPNWERMFHLRLHSNAQQETREVAQQIKEAIKPEQGD